jgi:hypothetical protein
MSNGIKGLRQYATEIVLINNLYNLHNLRFFNKLHVEKSILTLLLKRPFISWSVTLIPKP